MAEVRVKLLGIYSARGVDICGGQA